MSAVELPELAFSSPQMIIYWSAFCIAMSQLKCFIWSTKKKKCFTLPLHQTWLIHDRTSVKLNFTFFCVPQQKLLLYIPSKVVSTVTKSSACDDLFHVNCNVTNQTQTCFRSAQVTDCLPGVWVLVLYWRPFYFFFVVIVESLLCIFVYRSYCFRCSSVRFGDFCTEGNAVGFKFRFDMRYSIKFAKLHSAKCSQHKWAWWGAVKVSLFEMHKSDPFLPHSKSILWELMHSYVLSCFWVVSSLQHSMPAWLELFVDHTHTHSMNNLRWQPHWLPRLMSLPRKSHDWWRTQDCSLGQPTENKIIKNLQKHFFSPFFISLNPKLLTHLSIISMVTLHT